MAPADLAVFLPSISTASLISYPDVVRAKLGQGPHRWRNISAGIDAVLASVADWDNMVMELDRLRLELVRAENRYEELELELHQAAAA